MQNKMDEIRGTEELDFTCSQSVSVLLFIWAFLYKQLDIPFNNIPKQISQPRLAESSAINLK